MQTEDNIQYQSHTQAYRHYHNRQYQSHIQAYGHDQNIHYQSYTQACKQHENIQHQSHQTWLPGYKTSPFHRGHLGSNPVHKHKPGVSPPEPLGCTCPVTKLTVLGRQQRPIMSVCAASCFRPQEAGLVDVGAVQHDQRHQRSLLPPRGHQGRDALHVLLRPLQVGGVW